jgi:hypothetical protein
MRPAKEKEINYDSSPTQSLERIRAGNAGRRGRCASNAILLEALDSISLIGQHHQEGESSTAAVGRIAYLIVTGQEPQSEETKTVLSYLVHWIISMSISGGYGALRGAGQRAGYPGWASLGDRSLVLRR